MPLNTATAVQQPAVNFYILPDSDKQNRYFFVYRLLEKAIAQQLSTLIVAADNAQLQVLDRLLWTAKPARFIAHDSVGQQSQATAIKSSIVLTDDLAVMQTTVFKPQVVIDLSYDATPLSYPKIMLVANQHAEILPNARLKYQAYANEGIKPTVYHINERQLAFKS